MGSNPSGSDWASPAQGWFAVAEPEPGVFTIDEPLHRVDVRSFLIVGGERALLLDTGTGVGDIRSLVAALTDRPLTVVNSHCDWDHVGGNGAFAAAGTPLLIHAAEAARLERGIPNAELRRSYGPDSLLGPTPAGFDLETFAFPPTPPTGLLHGGERFDLGGRTLDVIHAPGHTPGGIVLLDRANGVLFSTDVADVAALYAFGPRADLDVYRRTLAMLADLAPALSAVLPCHGPCPFAPGRLLDLRDAMELVAAGRPPDEVTADFARHEFDGFSILARPTRGGAAG